MKYRAKRDFLGVTKGMEFPTADGEICIPTKMKATSSICWIDPTQYPDDFELVEEPKYTDSDLDWFKNRLNELCTSTKQSYREDINQVIAELKQSKEKK